MISGSLARRYAKALLQLGIEGKDYERLGAELERVTSLVEGSPELKAMLESPVFPHSQRKAVLHEVLRRLAVAPVLEHFVLLVLDHNRFASLPAINRELRTLVDQQANRVRATVTSAKPLREPELQRIRGALERRTGKHVIVEKREDASLIGGVVVQVGDVVYDGSVKTQLERIREQLLASE
jgi:F-type H+-transporting ATPase subunit delta